MNDKLIYVGQLKECAERHYFRYIVPADLQKEIEDAVRAKYGDHYCAVIEIDIKVEKTK